MSGNNHHVGEYARKILRVFAGSFPNFEFLPEKSKLELDGWEDLFPGLKVPGESDEKRLFLEALTELSGLGIIKVYWKTNKTGQSVKKLSLKDLPGTYSILAEENIWEVFSACRTRLESWQPVYGYGTAVKEYLLNCLDERHPMPIRETRDLTDLIKLLDTPPKTIREQGLENVCDDLCGGPERAEYLFRIGDRLARESAGTELSRIMGVKVTSERVYFSLCGTLYLSGEVELSWERELTSLPLEILQLAESLSLLYRFPVTIVQNKISYYTLAKKYNRKNGGFIHGGTCPNGAVKELLKLICRTDSRLQYFGDLDPRGLEAYTAFRNLCGDKLTPIHMDLSTYRKSADYGHPLTDADLEELAGADIPELDEVIQAMRKKKAGVKQEYIRLLPLSF